ncbi:MAG: Gmad2 immunoglobulin-like domain-containing protein [Nocardioidaceae bacterium]
MNPTDHDDELRSLLDDAVSGVEPRHGLATIRSRTAAPPRRGWAWATSGAALAVAATVAAVLVLGGSPRPTTASPGPAGSAASASASAATPSEVSSSRVVVEAPAPGAILSSPFRVSGRASAFEANVQWELMAGSSVVERGFTTAEECCTLSPFSFQVTAPPGDYTLVVHDEDVSGGEGNPPARHSQSVTVR